MLATIAPSLLMCVLIAQSESPGREGKTEESGRPKHTNRLIDSSSPYLLQHAHNPVDWYPWGEEAFQKAREENKPIFLSIGYAACHWCHVMERESFENEEIARLLNEHFVAIKVDREQRPDVDEIYMSATQEATGSGGWPMSVFLTVDLKPFFCGTYFPPQARYGRPGFRDILTEIADRWKNDKTRLLREAQDLVAKVTMQERIIRGHEVLERDGVGRYVQHYVRTFDPELGGQHSSGNKFPPTAVMELILHDAATQTDESRPIDVVETTLTEMGKGGIYDQLGGGICRYSTDPRWFAPHFEKMLYDQARVSGVYLSGFQMTQHEPYARLARGILDYCLRDLQAPEGAFYSSRDADSEGQEGQFYTWTYKEIRDQFKQFSPRTIRASGDRDPGKLLCEYFNIIPEGNWHGGRNILYVKTTDEEFAEQHGLKVDEWLKLLEDMKQFLFQVRKRREHPRLDDKILVEWNGLLITSLARGARILNEPRYREAAEKATDFVLNNMVRDGRLYRVHRRGTTHIPGNAADYANLVEGLITLYETTGKRRWLDAAVRFNSEFIRLFRDENNGGFFYTAGDTDALLVRSKHAKDGVVPSPNSTAVHNFLRLSLLLGRSDLRDLAEDTMEVFLAPTARMLMPRMLWGVIFYHDAPKEIAVIGQPDDDDAQELLNTVYREYVPNKVVAFATPEQAAEENAPPLIKSKTLVQGKAGAYVCRNYVCGNPVNTPEELIEQIKQAAGGGGLSETSPGIPSARTPAGRP